ncbi:MAG: cell envelope integrity protein CreD [Acidobacteriota bacterium]
MEPNANPTLIQRLGESTFVKLATLGFLLLLLLLPVSRVRSLVNERMGRQQEVRHEITRTWGSAQTLLGPVLTVPVEVLRERPVEKEGDAVKTYWQAHYVRILPKSLSWQGEVNPEIRNRGLFEVVLYESELAASGHFEIPDLGGDDRRVRWQDAEVALLLSTPRGLQREVILEWGDGEYPFRPGAGLADGLGSGIRVPLSDLAADSAVPFSFDLSLRGAEELLFIPVGDLTTVALGSPWQDPGFVGSFLPQQRRLDAAGFAADWQVPAFGRGFPGLWWDGQVADVTLDATAFGVSLILPADAYQQTERAVKYAMLFIVLTFGTFFLLEVTSPRRLHAVQYLLVGFAQSVFYVLLLALAEHLGFAAAYGLAAVATVGLIAAYSASVLGGWRRAGIVGVSLALLYGYLFVLLRLEDLALLVGAVGLFAVLALLMIATRHLDWFSLRWQADR